MDSPIRSGHATSLAQPTPDYHPPALTQGRAPHFVGYHVRADGGQRFQPRLFGGVHFVQVRLAHREEPADRLVAVTRGAQSRRSTLGDVKRTDLHPAPLAAMLRRSAAVARRARSPAARTPDLAWLAPVITTCSASSGTLPGAAVSIVPCGQGRNGAPARAPTAVACAAIVAVPEQSRNGAPAVPPASSLGQSRHGAPAGAAQCHHRPAVGVLPWGRAGTARQAAPPDVIAWASSAIACAARHRPWGRAGTAAGSEPRGRHARRLQSACGESAGPRPPHQAPRVDRERTTNRPAIAPSFALPESRTAPRPQRPLAPRRPTRRENSCPDLRLSNVFTAS
jgi:hypothetical protein